MTEAEVLSAIATDPVVWHNWTPYCVAPFQMSIDEDQSFEIVFTATEESKRHEAEGEMPYYLTRTTIEIHSVYATFTDDDDPIEISQEGMRKIEDFVMRKIHEF